MYNYIGPTWAQSRIDFLTVFPEMNSVWAECEYQANQL